MHEKTKVISNYGPCCNSMLISYKELNFLYQCFIGAQYGYDRQDMSLHCKKEADLPKVNSTLA